MKLRLLKWLSGGRAVDRSKAKSFDLQSAGMPFCMTAHTIYTSEGEYSENSWSLDKDFG